MAEAERPQLYEVIAPQAPLRREPSPDAALGTEALKGERAAIDEISDEGWAHGRLEADGYVGFLPASALAPPGPAATHKVTALRTLIFPGPSIKLPPLEALPMGSRVAIARVEGTLAVTHAGGFLPARHLVPIEINEPDFVTVAERFLGAPYLWGGKTSLGLDCSGLVQISLTACGVRCLRDTVMQEPDFAPSPSPRDQLQRGDLVFWEGHVAIVRDAATLIHANAFHMAVAIEPIAEAIERIRAAGAEVTSVRRPGSLA
jgi:cell wall-associated NlpC family hydrolase